MLSTVHEKIKTSFQKEQKIYNCTQKVLNFIEISSLVSNKNFSSDKNILLVSSRSHQLWIGPLVPPFSLSSHRSPQGWAVPLGLILSREGTYMTTSSTASTNKLSSWATTATTISTCPRWSNSSPASGSTIARTRSVALKQRKVYSVGKKKKPRRSRCCESMRNKIKTRHEPGLFSPLNFHLSFRQALLFWLAL